MPSKLHLNLSNKPACGRQLNNHREQRAQLQDRVVLTDWESFKIALGNSLLGLPGPKACRHCAKETGLLPRVSRKMLDQVQDEMLEDPDEEDEEGEE